MQTKEQLENIAALNTDVQIIELETPLKMGNTEITSLEIRKPNVLALQGVKIADLLQGDVNAICAVLPKISTPSLTKSQIVDLEPADLSQIGGAIMLFLQPRSVRAEILRQQ